MSGFCGLIYKHPVPQGSDADFRLRQQLAQLMRGVASRGPHASDSWVSGRVGLGHHLLREVPEAERETQPLTSPDGRFVIVFDGRIDNRDEIFTSLDSYLRPRADCPDVEIVLAAHRCWADDAPRRLLGDFAYAVWDTVEQVLVAVRDPLAGRPFYYVDREDFFAFASHDETLLCLPGISSAPNENHIAALFLPSLNDFDVFASWYLAVRCLRPAHSLCLKRFKDPIEFKCRTLPAAAARRFASPYDAVEAFESVLSAAVAARLRTYGPPAMLLSGGIDSASVITVARPILASQGRAPIRTYSAISDDESTCVESRAIRTLIESGPCTPSTVRTPSFEGGIPADVLATLVWRGAHPIDNSLVIHMPLFAGASADGCTSILNGVGGDVTTNTLGLYPAELIRRGDWLGAWSEAKATASHNTYLQHLSARQIFFRSVVASAPEAAKARLRWLKAGSRNSKQTSIDRLDAIFSRDFIARHNLRSRWRANTTRDPMVSMFDSGQQYMKSLDWLAHGQSGYDRLAGRFGLVSRDVWCDLRLVQFYLGLPVALRAGGGWTKSLVRAFLRTRGQMNVADRTDKQHIGWKFSQRLLDGYRPRAADASLISARPNDACNVETLPVESVFSARALGSRDQLPIADFDDFAMQSTVQWLNRHKLSRSEFFGTESTVAPD